MKITKRFALSLFATGILVGGSAYLGASIDGMTIPQLIALACVVVGSYLKSISDGGAK